MTPVTHQHVYSSVYVLESLDKYQNISNILYIKVGHLGTSQGHFVYEYTHEKGKIKEYLSPFNGVCICY